MLVSVLHQKTEEEEMATGQVIENGHNHEGDEISEPLILHREISVREAAEFHSSKGGSIWMSLLSTFVAVCGSVEFGTCVGYSSPAESGIISDLGLSTSEYSFFGSIATIGAMVGAVTSGPIADFIGRKGAMRLSSIFCIAGWIAVHFSKGVVLLDIGRLSTGYGMGVLSYVIPVFIAEVSPKNLRGVLTSMNQFLIVGGSSITYIIGTVVTWRTLALIGIIPCLVQLLGLFLIPESPRWLANVGDQIAFEKSLRKLRGKDADISLEAAEIHAYIKTLKELPKAKLFDLFDRRYLHSVAVGVGLMVFQQFGGINGVTFYVSSIFESAGFPSSLGTIIYACIQFPTTAICTFLMDKAGRRPLLLVSASGLLVGCVLTAIAFYMKVHELSLESVPILALTGILVYRSFFSVGMGTVPWVIMSEIFPINIKGTAGGFVTLINWFGSWVITFAFSYLMSWSSYGMFVLYAVVNALAILFVVKMVPETKGRTLEEIQAALN